MELSINNKFKDLIPCLSNEEFLQLEENILRDGIREPICVWNGVILDGHNRYSIAQKHVLNFQTKEMTFDNENECIYWIIKNQLGRRNITVFVRNELALKLKPVLQELAKNNLSNAGKGLEISTKVNTREELSIIANTSSNTISKVEKIQQNAIPKVIEIVRKNDISINQAEKISQFTPEKQERILPFVESGFTVEKAIVEIKKQERQEKIDTQIVDKSNSESIDIFTTKEKFRVIYADPCWSYNDKCEAGGVQSRGAEGVYPTMSIEQICALPVKEITEDNSVLFLWVTSPLLEDSFKVIKEWGFKYKSSFVWDKIAHNMGHYNSVRHEFLLVCTKGSCTPDFVKLFDSVQSIERTEHSKKPKEFRDIIDTLYTYGNKLEMFSRDKNDGWFVWGNMI